MTLTTTTPAAVTTTTTTNKTFSYKLAVIDLIIVIHAIFWFSWLVMLFNSIVLYKIKSSVK